MDRQSVPWTTGTLIEEWDAVVSFDIRSHILLERGYSPEALRQSANRGFFLRWRGVGDRTTTPLLSLEQLETGVRTSMEANHMRQPGDVLVRNLQLSRDKQWVAFDYWRRGSQSQDIWVFNVGQRKFARITQGEWFDEMPAWSPDSTRLAFYRTEPRVGHGWGTGETTHPAYALWVWDRRTSQSRQVAAPGQYAYYGRRSLVWSPDGTKVLHQWASDQSKEAAGVYLVDVNTGETRRLSQEAGPAEGPVTIYLFSPDGRRVLYAMRGHLFVVGSDGRGRVPVLAGRPFALAKWDTDGSRIFVLEVRGDHWQWSSARPDGSDLQPITPPPGYRIVDVFTYME
jgi:Tol biopolymer transport system component